MKKIVVYQSATGFTKRYAVWIAEKLNCEYKHIRLLQPNELDDYDLVVFGGWIMGNVISGLTEIKKLNPKNLIIFGVGSATNRSDVVEAIRSRNLLTDESLFYFEGGIDFQKMIRKSIAKKEFKSSAEMEMEQKLSNSFDNCDEKFIEPLIEHIKSLE